MDAYDLCLAWNWEYDADFVQILKAACQSKKVSLLEATPDNLSPMLEALLKNEVFFRVFLDRASESDPDFQPLVQWAFERCAYRINPQEKAVHAINKASMHLEFITAGLYTPYTIILPPYHEQPILPPLELAALGESFTIKPAHGGGGEGVIIEARSLAQVHEARHANPLDYYLLQAHITPVSLEGRPAWFRIICCTGKVYPCWWDPVTHLYTRLSPEEEKNFGLTPLYDATQTIAKVCGLDMFSTEIALTAASHFVSVDYVNDLIDMRVKSNTHDGVPDEIVHNVAERLVDLVLAYRLPASGEKI